MLRTNSKKVSEKIKAYIMENFTNPSDLGIDEMQNPTNYAETVKCIYDEFIIEKAFNTERMKKYYGYSEYRAFKDWLQGLPSIFDPMYYYNGLAVQVLGDILEETEEERNKYTSAEAEETLTKLIYREIQKEVTK